jgi:hypothetical protein
VAAVDATGRRIAVAAAAGALFREVDIEFAVVEVFEGRELLAVRNAAREIAVMRPPAVLVVLRVTSDVPVAACASVDYNGVVVGTAGGGLLFFSLRSGRILGAVTHGFGFVVVALPGRLALFTVNGTRIREREFVGAITAWVPCVNRRGFDFLVVAIADGSIAIMEVFTLEMRLLTCGNTRRPAILAGTIDAFVVTKEGGQGYEIPCDPAETTANAD